MTQMRDELGVSRRTVERLREQISTLLPELSYKEDENRVRHWRLPPRTIPQVPPSHGTLGTLETLARDLAASGDDARAGDVREALTCLRTMFAPETLRKVEPDIEALLQAEGVAMHPGPRQKLDREMLGMIREAVLGFRKLSARYRQAGATEASARVLCPYGVLYGRRAYLVAHTEAGTHVRLWRLDRLDNLNVLEDGFSPQSFDLAAYASRSFGVFQEPAQEVVLRFASSAAEDAAEWQFHPTQTTTPQADGSLLVCFTCGGMLELSWHLYTWGEAVEVVAPAGLKALFQPAIAMRTA
ncbi:helix-turn-helix transcriptional regulator [Acidocella aromatica]|uniref:Putative DNA-binding transcriptional regulator YafY n=1 Tax=Acidocella aromatica TaxID=1303579 RepID=A0A840VMV5_9PROT|nr:WYL domain-containing protein [Acidocella aromatica]MBB5374455.1 putative DNA-binding transcriptional regulator YafY [Acidocella aromatica]